MNSVVVSFKNCQEGMEIVVNMSNCNISPAWNDFKRNDNALFCVGISIHKLSHWGHVSVGANIHEIFVNP